jgi:hypothetical protein
MRIRFNNKQSKYELTYLKWEGIHYDRVKLKRFIFRYNLITILSKVFKSYKEELEVLNGIIDHYGRSKVFNLINNDDYTSRLAHIERLSRLGSVEILTTGSFNPDTYHQISNLPKTDYDLVSKRIQELIKIGQRVTIQDDIIGENIPNDKIQE